MSAEELRALFRKISAEDDSVKDEAAGILQEHVRGLAVFFRRWENDQISFEDIIQEIVERCFSPILSRRLAEHPTPGAYLSVMFRNRLRDSQRRSAAQRRLERAYAAEPPLDGDDPEFLNDADIRIKLAKALEGFAERDRKLLDRVYWRDSETTYRDIGEELGMTPTYVATRLHRLLKILRKALSDGP